MITTINITIMDTEIINSEKANNKLKFELEL